MLNKSLMNIKLALFKIADFIVFTALAIAIIVVSIFFSPI